MAQTDVTGNKLTQDQIEALLKYLEGQIELAKDAKERETLNNIIEATKRGEPIYTRYLPDDLYKALRDSNLLAEYNVFPAIYDDNKACRKFVVLPASEANKFEAAVMHYFYAKNELSEVSKEELAMLAERSNAVENIGEDKNKKSDNKIFSINNLTKVEIEFLRQKITDDVNCMSVFNIEEYDNITEEDLMNGVEKEKTYTLSCLNEEKGKVLMAYYCMKAELYNKQTCEKRETIGEALREEALDNGEKRENINNLINSGQPFSLCEINKDKDERGNEQPTYIKKELKITDKGFEYYKGNNLVTQVKKGSLNYEDVLLKCVDDIYDPIAFTEEEARKYGECENARERKEFLTEFLKDKDYKNLLNNDEREYVAKLDEDFKNIGSEFYEKINSEDFDFSELTDKEKEFYQYVKPITEKIEEENIITTEVVNTLNEEIKRVEEGKETREFVQTQEREEITPDD